MNNYTSIQYLIDDYPRTLFPLSTTEIVAKNSGDEIIKHINEKIFVEKPEHSFLSQAICYSSKQGFNLRRTVKLDPVAEIFIYDIVYRNRGLFRQSFKENRLSFGYRFKEGKPISQSNSYVDFKSKIADAKTNYKFVLKCDITNYFNSLYHHYIVQWFSSIGASEKDFQHLGIFLRQANSGISIDCLPQGIHPCKIIGAEFLKFIDNSTQLKCNLLFRFMDDLYLFADQKSLLIDDLITIQRLLGEKGLSLNSAKTFLGNVNELDIAKTKEIDRIKISLLRKRRTTLVVSDIVIFEEEKYYKKLTEEQVEYLLNLLQDPDIDESDAELVLILLRDHGTDVLSRINTFLERFPSLIRSIYHFSKYVEDKTSLASLILNFIKTGQNVTEDQLFWLAKLTEDYLSTTSDYPDILLRLYKHPNATLISRAKILEIPERKACVNELREPYLRSGQSDWLAWASAVGTRGETTIRRNHTLTYFSNASPMNKIIGDCIKNLP